MAQDEHKLNTNTSMESSPSYIVKRRSVRLVCSYKRGAQKDSILGQAGRQAVLGSAVRDSEKESRLPVLTELT